LDGESHPIVVRDSVVSGNKAPRVQTLDDSERTCRLDDVVLTEAGASKIAASRPSHVTCVHAEPGNTCVRMPQADAGTRTPDPLSDAARPHTLGLCAD
jgi:hypothetical protein